MCLFGNVTALVFGDVTVPRRKGERVPKEEEEEGKNQHENFRGLTDVKYWPGLMGRC